MQLVWGKQGVCTELYMEDLLKYGHMEEQRDGGEMCPEEVNQTALGTGPAVSLLATH